MSKKYRVVILFACLMILTACGGGGDSASNNDNGAAPDPSVPVIPDTTTSDPVTPDPVIFDPVNPDPVTNAVRNQSEAAEFLNRATFGPTKNSIDELVANATYENWLDDQFNMSPDFHLDRVKALGLQMCANINDDDTLRVDSWEYRFPRHQIWWETATNSDDQLRQRVALALSEILVISDQEGLGLSEYHLAVTSYYDVLVKHAFGNYRDLLEEVALHPAMGDFLSMTRNQKENADGTIRPDENFARENLQLFTIGVHELNLDGTKKRQSDGSFIPTYDQKTIEEFAKVFTGWSYSDKEWNQWAGQANRVDPLIAFEEFHDTSAKTLLNNEISPSGQTALTDLKFAMDNIFKHPNVGPYIGEQLIQRLVTSNPSPAYVQRVAEKFNDNGNGVKGDMKAIISAILLDPEALAETKPDNFGKLREPMLRMSHLWRAFNMQTSTRVGHYWDAERTCGQGTYSYYNFYTALPNLNRELSQGPLQARSVFNFFRPDFSPNGLLNDNGLNAPEFQIINENTMVSSTNLFNQLIEKFSTDEVFTPELEDKSLLDMREVTNIASNSEDLLDYLSLVLLNNEMSPSLNDILTEHLNTSDVFDEGKEGQFQKAREAIMLVMSSPEYLIQK